MIKIKPFKQSRGMCGPASMKMIMDYYGVVRSEKHWARLTANKINEKTGKIDLYYGCSEFKMVEAAKALGFKALTKQHSSIVELKRYAERGVPVMVNWFSENGSHFSVVVGFEKNKIVMVDPHIGLVRKFKIEEFTDRWFDFLGPPSQKNLLLRGVVVIHQSRVA